ncbi:hypothetical protein K8S19_03045, partial [bacterium]|nr:hypothetical protein [bacterium]
VKDVGNAAKSVADNNFGLTGARHTETEIQSSQFDGKTTWTFAQNKISEVETDVFDEEYGTPKHSFTKNLGRCLIGVQNTETWIETNPVTGMNTKTVAENAISKVTTDKFDEQYGTPRHSHTFNKFGLAGAENTYTDIKANPFNGLNTNTFAENDISTVTTDKFDKQYGTPKHSVTVNKFGLTGAQPTSTEIKTDPFDGLNTWTFAENTLSTVETDKFDEQYGTPKHSITTNKFGLTGAQHTDMEIKSNPFNGLNTWTLAVNAISIVETDEFDEQYGTPKHSIATNKFGLTGTKITNTTIKTNPKNGLNTNTLAVNELSTVETYEFDNQYGTPKESKTTNEYGLTGAKITNTTITTNPVTGMNTKTVAENANSTVTTDQFHPKYGTPMHSSTDSKYGLLGTKITTTVITASPFNGLSVKTVADNYNSTAITHEFDKQYGTPKKTRVLNKFGLRGAACTDTEIEANPQNGLNIWTFSKNELSTVETDKFDEQYGTAMHTITINKYGLLDSAKTDTVITADTANGLNIQTVTTNKLNAVVTTYDKQYGVPVLSVQENDAYPTLARKTTTKIIANIRTGLNIRTVAENGLSVITTDAFDQKYGTARHSMTRNKYCSGTGNRWAETVTDADTRTGLNKQTFTITSDGSKWLSRTWTNYDAQYGTQTDAISMMNEDYALGGAVFTKNTYECSKQTGRMTESTSINHNGKTKTFYENGLGTFSQHWAAYGLAGYTETTMTPNYETGVNVETSATAYSRMAPEKVLSVSKTAYDKNGRATDTKTHNMTGPQNARESTTHIDDFYEFSGSKMKTTSTTLMGTSQAMYNQKGVEMYSNTEGKYGVNLGRESETVTTSWNKQTGIVNSKQTKSDLSINNTYTDENGLPGHVNSVSGYPLWKENESFIGAADGAKRSNVYCAGDLQWSGQPSRTWSISEDFSATDSTRDENGFVTHSVNYQKYASNGNQKTWTDYKVNPNTGMNVSSVKTLCTYGYNGSRDVGVGWARKDTIETQYDPVYGCATKSVSSKKTWRGASYNRDGEVTRAAHWASGRKTTTDFRFNKDTGMTTWSQTFTPRRFYNLGTYDERGRKIASRTHKRRNSSSRRRKYEMYTSTFEYNEWTGLKTKEVRKNIICSVDKTVHYDQDGVELRSWTEDYEYPSGEVKHLTEYHGSGGGGNSTSSTTTWSGGGQTTRTVEGGGFTIIPEGDQYTYLPGYENTTYHQGTHITQSRIFYTMSDEGPVSAIVLDNQGTESWVMGNGYENSAILSRTRVNHGGSTITWNYTDDPTGLFHTSAQITYTDLYGTHTGIGSEEYTESGILTSRTMINDTTMNMTLTFGNDDQYLTTATGTREDGQIINYSYSGRNEIVASEDDKGITTWDQANQKMIETKGGLGSFKYTYVDDRVSKIEGQSAIDGSMVFDEYWNMQEWTDSKGIVHQYKGTEKNKGYWTQATESFTDTEGAEWTGTMNYDNFGFYFAGGELEAKNVMVDGTGAVNAVDMDESSAVEFIKGLLEKYHSEMETWSYQSSQDKRKKKTQGELQAEFLTAEALTQMSSVKVTINPDGTSTTEFSAIQFMEANFTKKNRYKPVSNSKNYSDKKSVPSGTFDAKKADDPFYKGNCGYKISNVQSYQIRVGTTPIKIHYLEVIPDDPETLDINEYEEIKHTSQVYWDHDDDPDTPDVGRYTKKTSGGKPIKGTRYRYTKTTYTKVADGWMWKSTGKYAQNAFDDALVQDTGLLTVSPIGQKNGNVRAAAVKRNYRKSFKNRGGAVLLAGGMDVKQAKTVEKISDVQVPRVPETDGVSAAVVTNDQVMVEKSGRKMELVDEASKVKSKPGAKKITKPKDELLVVFREIDSIEDALAFIKMVRGKMRPEAVARAVFVSRDVKIMNRLVKVYQDIFGEAQQATLLGKLTDMLLDNRLVLDQVSVAITGGKAISADLKMAAKIAKKIKDAKGVKRDEKGRVVEAVDQKGSKHRFKYEKFGITEMIVAVDGKTSVKHYDEADRMLSESSGSVSRTFKYELAENGQIEKTTMVERTEEGTKTFEYNRNGLLSATEKDGLRTEIVYTGKKGNNYTTKLYNKNGNVIEEHTFKNGRLARKKTRDGNKVSYAYITDDDDKVVAVTQAVEDADGGKTYLKFDQSGKLVSVQGKNTGRVKKMIKEGAMPDEALDFDAILELFSDPRMDGMRMERRQLRGVNE